MWRNWTIRLGCLCTVLLVLRYNLLCNVNRVSVVVISSTIDDEPYNPGDFINIGFSRFELEQVKLQETQLEHDYPITAILLHWQLSDNFKTTLKQLVRTTLFKQIIIWNNNPQMNLTVAHLLHHIDIPPNFIRIINSKENLNEAAKYRACAEAKTNACLYLQNDWRRLFPVKSLIASFRSDPTVLHSVTDARTYVANSVCSYFNSTIDLHTGCLWTDFGSIFLRQHAQQHLRLLEQLIVNYPAFESSSDICFAIWLNDIPSQLSTDVCLNSLSSGSDFPAWQYNSSILAVRILKDYLRFNRSNDGNVNFPRQTKRRFPYYVKSPSSNDDLIFFSNVLPLEISTISRIHDTSHFLSHNTFKAVDGQLSTCWRTDRDLHAGDFFAIDFLRARTNITFTLTVSHSRILQESLDLRVSFDGIWWISYRSLKGRFARMNQHFQDELYTILFDASRFALGFQSFRYISFQSSRNYHQRFQVCDIQIIASEILTPADYQELTSYDSISF